jgi:hypothetical protein
MTIVLNGTTGITNDGGYTGDGIVFADTTPANTLVTTTGGNVGIGTSSPSSDTRLTVLATSGTSVSAINSGLSTNFYAENTNTAGSNHTLFYGRANGADKIYILGNGTVSNATGVYGQISDQRLKENIVDATLKLSELNKLRVVNFNLIETPDVKQIGFIAQEVEQVFPSLIEEVTKPNTQEVYKSVKTSVLVPILVKAIQEQQAIITDLTTRLEALEAK